MRRSSYGLFLGSLFFVGGCQDTSRSSPAIDLGISAPYYALADGVVAATYPVNGGHSLRIVELDGPRKLTIPDVYPRPPLTGGGLVTFVVSEEGHDLNSDGDGGDLVLRVHDLGRGRTRDFRLAVFDDISQDGALIAFGVPERTRRGQERDLLRPGDHA